MLVGSASFTLLAGGLLGTGWILILRTYWEGQFTCSADIGLPDMARHLLGGAGVVLGVTVIVTLFLIARGPARIRNTHLATYWLATVGLWALLPLLAATGVSVNDCLRSLSL